MQKDDFVTTLDARKQSLKILCGILLWPFAKSELFSLEILTVLLQEDN